MGKREGLRLALRQAPDRLAFLLTHSALPGPRANLELIAAAALEGDREWFLRLVQAHADAASDQDPRVFPLLCGLVGLGHVVASGGLEQLPLLHRYANDGRWRVREAVAMALQAWGDRDPQALLCEMRAWSAGSPLEQRAAVAAVCEPRLLGPDIAPDVLDLMDAITSRCAASDHTPERRTLRQALGYGWSVVVVAYPEVGRARFEAWVRRADDPDVRWIVVENLKKSRLARLDAGWVRRMSGLIAPR